MKTLSCFTLAIAVAFAQSSAVPSIKPGRDPKQAIDEEYTKKIREFTTEPFFNSPLTDYLPASKTVPTPKAVLGDIAGAPKILPYSHEVYRYMRMLESASSTTIDGWSPRSRTGTADRQTRPRYPP